MKFTSVAIIGAGIAGLGAALRSRELKKDNIVFEAAQSAGGLLDNFVINGFRFDNAVHLSFATEPEVRRIFDKTPYFTHPAESRCFDKNIWFKHPVQNNLFPLPAEQKVELIKSFIERPDIENIENYEQWLISQYGESIASRYPIAYTHKYWGTPPNKLSTHWVGNRMRRAKLDEVLFGAFTSDTPNTYYTKEMRYPKNGGYKEFIRDLIDETNIELNSKVISIDSSKKRLEFESGISVTYTDLVSTLPLPEIIKIMTEVPDEVKEAAAKLEATSIDLISVGFNATLNLDLWMYIYDEDIYASRAYSPSVKSPNNAPAGCSSIQFEIYQRGQSPKFKKDELFENVRHAIRKMGMAKDDEIIFMHHKRLPWGNVIFDLGMEENREIVHDYLSAVGIKYCGRFGEWDYLWSNQSFLSGYKVI